MRTWVERLVTLALLVFIVWRLGPQLEALTGVGSEHERVPALRVVTLAGDTLGPAQLSGKVVVVNFWATWCPWCRFEMPSLERLYERHRGGDLVVLGLTVDAGHAGAVHRVLADRHITYPVARATSTEERALGGVSGIPTTVVIDRSGRVRYRVVGYFAPPALEAAVARLLAEPSPAGRRATRADGTRAARTAARS